MRKLSSCINFNYLRKNRVTFNEVIDYFANQRLQEYLNENPDTICIVSGGQGPNEPY